MAAKKATAAQKKFYTEQRRKAEDKAAAGDKGAQAEVSKIYGKLGRKAPKTYEPTAVSKPVGGRRLGASTPMPKGRQVKDQGGALKFPYKANKSK